MEMRLRPRGIRQSTLVSTDAPKVRNRIIPGLGKHYLSHRTGYVEREIAE